MSSSPLRELRADDAERVAALYAETFPASRLVDAEEVRSWLHNDELRNEWLRVLERDGKVVGYGDIWPDETHLRIDVAAPGFWDVFFDWAEGEARDRGIPCVRAWFEDGHALEEVVGARGYLRLSSSFRMEIELDDPPPPVMPPGIAIRSYRDRDAEPVRTAMNEAFVLDPFWHEVSPETFAGDFYVRSRGFDPLLWALAWDGSALAGFSLAYSERGGDTTLGWVGTLGVREPWRRRGLGEALLCTSFRTFWDRGYRRVGLGVDAANPTGAVRLYERVGMRQVQRSNGWVLSLS